MQFFNVIHDTTETFKTYNYSTNYDHNDGSKCSIHHAPLPLSIQNKCLRDGTNHLNQYQILCSRWSMIANIGETCELFAFPSSITMDESAIYGVYKFSLPSFPNGLRPSTVTFNRSNNTLYALNAYEPDSYFQSYNHRVYKLDFLEQPLHWKIARGLLCFNRFVMRCNLLIKCISMRFFNGFRMDSDTKNVLFCGPQALSDRDIEQRAVCWMEVNALPF